MNPGQFIASLGQERIRSTYFFRGPDRFLHEECRAAVVASIPAESRDWCLAEFEFAPKRLAEQLEGAQQMPMLGRRSFLLFSDPEDFDHATDDDYEALKAYLDRPSPFATVVFAAVAPDRRRRFVQLLDKKTEVVEMLPLSRQAAALWLTEYLRRLGVALAPGLGEVISARFESAEESSGSDSRGCVNLLWMRTEIEKLLTAKPGIKRLQPDDLEVMVSFRQEREIGKLLRAIAERNYGRALEDLRALRAGKQSEMLILWSIGDLFRQALKSSGGSLYDKNRGRFGNPYSTQEIAPFAVRRYSHPELLQALRHVRQADLGIKSSWKDSAILLEILIWQIVSGKNLGNLQVRLDELPLPAP